MKIQFIATRVSRCEKMGVAETAPGWLPQTSRQYGVADPHGQRERTSVSIPLSKIWDTENNSLPPDWPRYSLDENAAVGLPIGPVTYQMDHETVERYSKLMGVETAIYPNMPARIADILRTTPTANARMMLELFEPIRAGDDCTLSGSVIALYIRRGKPYATYQVETRRSDGVLMDRLRKTVILSRKDVADKWTFL